MHHQMVTSFKGQIYFGSIPTLILFLMLPYLKSSCSFMLIKQLHFIPLLKTYLQWRPFWFLIRLDSNGCQSRISQFDFFQIRIIYCLSKKSNRNHLEWPHTKTIRQLDMTKRGTSGNQFTIWVHFVNKLWFDKFTLESWNIPLCKYNCHKLFFWSIQSIYCLD